MPRPGVTATNQATLPGLRIASAGLRIASAAAALVFGASACTGPRDAARTPPASARTPLDDVYREGFFDMKDFYQYGRRITVDDKGMVSETVEMITDLPTQIVTVVIGSYRKSVTDYLNPPTELRDLEEKIDEVAGTARWVDGLPQR